MAKFDKLFEHTTETKKPETHPRRETKWIHYTKLIDNAAQYCNAKDKEEIIALAALIDADTEVLQNLIVRKADTDEYEIIAGHKRRLACKYLVEEEDKKRYEFLPCTVKNISNVRSEFQVYSTNSHHPKTDYEKMHELERMKYLLETYPDEFPHLQTGRMVDRLAKQYSLSKTTVGEFLTIANNLSNSGRDKFEKGGLKKSAAVELAGLPANEQEELLEKGLTSHKEIKEYKEKKEKKQKKEEYCSSFPDVVCNIKDIQKKHFMKDGNVDGCAGCCRGCNKAKNCPYVCGVGLYTRNYVELTEKLEEKEQDLSVLPVDQIPMDQEQCTEQLPGQLAVVNTEMEIAEDVPNFGTQSRNDEGQNLDCKDAAVEQASSVPVQEPLTKEKIIEEEYPPKYFLDEQKERLNTMLYNQALGAIVPDKALERQKTIVCALANMVCELDNIALKEEMEQLPQPDLPVLKNNDQRKEFIESYKEWSVWIDQPLTGETYYRYVLNNKVSIVVKVSRKHVWQQYKETKEYEYAAEQYYLLGIKMKFSQNGTKIVEDESRTFYECSQNKSALVEFLKEYQKGNISSGQ